MEEIFLKRDELVLKHKQLSATLKVQKEIKLTDLIKATQKELKKIERQYAKIQNQIEDYYYSLPDEEADKIVKPNTEDIKEMYNYVHKTATKVSNEVLESDLKFMRGLNKGI